MKAIKQDTMKSFIKKIFSILSISILALLISVLIAEYNPNLAEAGVGHNVSGYAWSDNIGWISFNNTSDGSGVDYGVNINPVSGDFSGYAWSDNIGWINFFPTSGYPEGPNHGVKKDGSNVTGWAKALSADNKGWDGWIKMSGSWANGVTIDSGTGGMSGYAWGSDVVGWIDFNPDYVGGSTKVVFDTPECTDGIDNNNNGWIDENDPGCSSGNTEGTSPTYQCSDGVDNDGDSFIDGNDPQCTSSADNLEAPDPNFSLGASPANIQVNVVSSAATSTEAVISITPIAGFNSNVTFDASSAIPGVAYHFTPTVVGSPYSTSVIFKIVVSNTVMSGVYPITIRGTGGGLDRTTLVSLNVELPDPDFSEF